MGKTEKKDRAIKVRCREGGSGKNYIFSGAGAGCDTGGTPRFPFLHR